MLLGVAWGSGMRFLPPKHREGQDAQESMYEVYAQNPGRNNLRSPPHFGPEGIFELEGGGGVYLEAPHGRIFTPLPPLLYAPHP